MRLLLTVGSLAPGGAERVLCRLAEGWAGEGCEVWLLTIAGSEGDFYDLPPAVRRIELRLAGESRSVLQGAWANLRRARALRAAIRRVRPEVIVSFMPETNVLTLLAAAGLRVPVVVAERNDPRHQPLGRLWRDLRRFLYPGASVVVVQTERVAAWARSFVPTSRVRVIPNPVRIPADGPPVELAVPGAIRLAAVGRLDRQKGFDLLLHACAHAMRHGVDLGVVIVGEGECRLQLEGLASTLGLADRVRMIGLVPEPASVLRQADIFVLSSRFEGFPNVLLEAMALGLAVVAFDCESGPAEVVTHGVDGLLISPEDPLALGEAIVQLARDPTLRRTMGHRARSVRDRFAFAAVFPEWDAVVRAAVAGRGKSR